MKHSYLLAGIKAGSFITMIARNKGFSVKHILKILFLLNAGLWSSVFSKIEKIKFSSQIINIKKLQAPVFIVGNWRTGTTFLHQLLSLDKQFATPTLFQVSNPDHFLVSRKYYAPIMSKALGSKRPMDNVKIGVDEPQEDEYALLKLCKNTPLEKLIFNNGGESFLESDKDFMPGDEQGFIDSIQLLVKKLTLGTDKKVLFKNPFHSLRLPLLRNVFPDSKYIHIYRDPNNVVPSSIHMWDIVGSQNVLKGQWISPSIAVIANLYKKIITAVREQSKTLRNNQFVEINFEKLELDPIACVKGIYSKLELEYTEVFHCELVKYCGELKTYKKNKYNSIEPNRKEIKRILEDVLPEYF